MNKFKLITNKKNKGGFLGETKKQESKEEPTRLDLVSPFTLSPRKLNSVIEVL